MNYSLNNFFLNKSLFFNKYIEISFSEIFIFKYLYNLYNQNFFNKYIDYIRFIYLFQVIEIFILFIVIYFYIINY